MKKKTSPKKNGSSNLVIINLKVSKQDRRAILAKAKRFAKGNLSAWLRYAGLKYAPAKKAAIGVKPYRVV